MFYLSYIIVILLTRSRGKRINICEKIRSCPASRSRPSAPLIPLIYRDPRSLHTIPTIPPDHDQRSLGVPGPHAPVAKSPTHPTSSDSRTSLVINLAPQRDCIRATLRWKKQADPLSDQFDHLADSRYLLRESVGKEVTWYTSFARLGDHSPGGGTGLFGVEG
jgi:hypothetical protein